MKEEVQKGPKQIVCYQVVGSSSLGEQCHITGLVVCVLGDFLFIMVNINFLPFNNVKGYNSVAFTMLCTHHHYPFPKCFHLRKQN